MLRSFQKALELRDAEILHQRRGVQSLDRDLHAGRRIGDTDSI